MIRTIAVYVAGFALLLQFSLVVYAADERAAQDYDDLAFVSLGFENDTFVRRDGSYTAGQRLAFVSPVGKALFGAERWGRALPLVSEGDKIRSQLTFSQHIFTAEDIALVDPPAGTRPYGGWLNADYALQAWGDGHLDIWSFGIGITGEPSGAELAQRTLHNILPNQQDPLGWGTQIRTEPTFQLGYDRIWFIGHEKGQDAGAQFDFQPRLSLRAGTAISAASVGALMRFGNRLSPEPGPEFLAPTGVNVSAFRPAGADQVNWYGFIGADVRTVLHNLFLDGGTFRSNPRDENSEFLVLDLMAGFVLTGQSWRFSTGLVSRSEEFAAQQRKTAFGFIQLSFPF